MFAFASDKIRFFQYRETRSVQFLAERFREYRGVLVTDGFKSYDTLCRDLQIEHAACWQCGHHIHVAACSADILSAEAHVRRKFVEFMKLMKADSFAHQIVEEIRKLYAVEARCREKGFQEEFTLQQRQEHSRKIVDLIFERLKAKQSEVPESLPLGEAIRYALGQESKLRVFLENSHVPIDTNVVENAIRPFVVGRKTGCSPAAHAARIRVR
jgi:transposase